MSRWAAQWWEPLRIQHKVWVVLLLLCVPLVGGLAVQLYFVQQQLALQQQRQDLALAYEQVHQLRRLAIDVEDGFRGYVLTGRPAFLAAFVEAEAKIDSVMAGATKSLAGRTDLPDGLGSVERQWQELLRTKHELIAEVQRGSSEKALAYVRSGEGLLTSDRLRGSLRAIEDRFERQRESLNERDDRLSQRTFVGLWIALGGVMVLGWLSSRMLARSLTDPIVRLHAATARMGEQVAPAEITELLTPLPASKDELGRLTDAYRHMLSRIETHIRELEVLDSIGHEINSIGPDGLEGVLRRIADRAVELVQADVCLVLLRNEQMGCWVVEAASGEWSDRLKNAVMLWEEFPVCVQAYQSRQSSVGEHFRRDQRPEVARRNFIGDSMLAIPLLAQGAPFGVLALLSERPRAAHQWNQRLAQGMAQEAALAISNARLYEAAQQEQRGLLARLRQLEHLAETLAHDLKGPGERMEELAKLLAQKFAGQIDERTARWLSLIQENGSDLVRRVEGILEVARLGAGQGAVTAVAPSLVLQDVLKAQAEDIERSGATVHVDPWFPLVACHGAYLRQVFDNVVSNALKYARPGEPPVLTISSTTTHNMVCFSVRDRGIGIPPDQRSRVFQPFVRLKQAEAAGSGIGLAIVQRIVELYGGRVWIEGDEGEGCTVKFTLPWLREEGSTVISGLPGGALTEASDAPAKGRK